MPIRKIDKSKVLPFNPIYTIPDSAQMFGDRSDAYANLRQRIDQTLPIDPRLSLQFTTLLRRNKVWRPGDRTARTFGLSRPRARLILGLIDLLITVNRQKPYGLLRHRNLITSHITSYTPCWRFVYYC